MLRTFRRTASILHDVSLIYSMMFLNAAIPLSKFLFVSAGFEYRKMPIIWDVTIQQLHFTGISTWSIHRRHWSTWWFAIPCPLISFQPRKLQRENCVRDNSRSPAAESSRYELLSALSNPLYCSKFCCRWRSKSHRTLHVKSLQFHQILPQNTAKVTISEQSPSSQHRVG